jgi:hypothetical protein
MSAALFRRMAAGVAVLLVSVAAAAAQVPEQPDPLESMPIRFGPVGISPSLAVTDVGVDSNIFSSAEDPREDFTATIAPRVIVRLRGGPMLLTVSNTTGFVYFHEFADERNVNYSWETRADFALGRLRPYLGAALADTRERLNAELDIRAPRRQSYLTGGAHLAVATRTAATFEFRRGDLDFDEGVSFEGVPLSRTMNDRTDSFDGGLLVTLTPLTTFGINATWLRDRFEQAPERDANSFRIMPSLRFDPTALIQGSIAVGYRKFDPLGPALAPYAGVVVQAAVGYTLLDRTRFDFRATRDVQYSFETDEPYYLSTGARLDVTYQLVGPFDVRASGGRERLGYRKIETGNTDRTDVADLLGIGVGYRLRDDIRLGIAWETTSRESDRPDRRYDRRRIVASLAYGL